MTDFAPSQREQEQPPSRREPDLPAYPAVPTRLSVSGVLALQRGAGNQATSRALGRSSSPRVLARANLRWTPGPKPVIQKIDFGPRTGVQDDHTTAFTAFKEAVNQNLCGKPLGEAVIQLYFLVNEITELEGYKDARYGLPGEVSKLLTHLMGLMERSEAEPMYVSGELGAAIDDYLRLRNRVPGTKEKKSAVIRDGNAPAPGKLEKEGKNDLKKAIEQLRSGGGSWAAVEVLLQTALAKLQDYVTTRKVQPSKDEFADVVIQHYQSIMQVSPVLYPVAEQLFDTWMKMVTTSWGGILGLDKTFADRVRDACSHYVKASGGKQSKGEFVDDGKEEPMFEDDPNMDADDGYRLPPNDADELPKEWIGKAKVVDARHLSRSEIITLLNTMGRQGMIRAAELIEHIIGQNQEKQNDILDNLDVKFGITSDGRVFFKLRGG